MKYELVMAIVPADEIEQVAFPDNSRHAHIVVDDPEEKKFMQVAAAFASYLHEQTWPELNGAEIRSLAAAVGVKYP